MSIHRNYLSRVLTRAGQRWVCLLNVCALVIALFLLCFAHQVDAECVMDISDTPMDTKVVTAPPNIMFVLDDSGSMDWEFMVQGATDGKFEGNIEYVFDIRVNHLILLKWIYNANPHPFSTHDQ